MKRSVFLYPLILALVFAFALMPAGCIRPRPEPTAVPTKLSLNTTKAPTALPTLQSATPGSVAAVDITPGAATPEPTATTAGPEATAVSTPAPTQASEPTAEAVPTAVPTTVPTVAPAGGAAGGEATYQVVWGDTLSGIARRFGTTVDAILARNPRLTDRNRVYAGMVLVIPSGSTSPSSNPTASPSNPTVVPGEAIDYVVQRGDTLSSIARRFGTTIDAILRENPWITNRNYVQAGRHLAITMGSGATPPSTIRTHVVRPGDTLTSLARLYNTTIWSIVVRNNLSNANRIYVGQVLIIP